jgi:hypothetical protein
VKVTQLQHIHCTHCHEPVTVLFELAEDLGRAAPTEQLWLCPHMCGLAERRPLDGRIVDVWAGHSPERPPRIA